jgi:uncharacterized protein YggE
MRRACLVLGLLAATPLLAQEPPRAVSVQGEGVASAAPALARASLGVAVEAESAGAASAAARDAAAGIIAALVPDHLAEAELRTAAISLSPVHDRDDDGGGERIERYRAQRMFEAELPMEGLGAALDAAVAAGANQIGGVSLDVADRAALETEARRRAYAEAEARARTLAQAAGARLGAPLSIVEGRAPTPFPGGARMMAMESSGGVAAGELDVRVEISATFALEPAR